jgi:hypothetical protein
MKNSGDKYGTMQLTPFHMNIAKRFSAGERNRDILKDVDISESRLSILKGKPEFQAVVDRYRAMHERPYEKALEIFREAAGRIAEALVTLVTDPETPEKVRLEAAKAILDRLAQAEMPEGFGGNQNEEEMTFEHLLRITKRSMGSPDGGYKNDSWE